MSDPFGAKSAKKAAAAQEKVAALKTQQQNLSAAKNRTDVIRQSRQARAVAQQAAASQGVSTSSAAQGGQGSLQSQLTSNLSFLDNQNLIVDQASVQLGVQRKYQAKAEKSKRIWNLGVKALGTGLKLAAGG